jgi:hypothetical protein
MQRRIPLRESSARLEYFTASAGQGACVEWGIDWPTFTMRIGDSKDRSSRHFAMNLWQYWLLVAITRYGRSRNWVELRELWFGVNHGQWFDRAEVETFVQHVRGEAPKYRVRDLYPEAAA